MQVFLQDDLVVVPDHQPGVLPAGGHHLAVLGESEVSGGSLVVDWSQRTGGKSGHQLHQSPVFLPPAGGAGAELPAGGEVQLRPDLLSPQAVTAGHPEPPPADQGAGDNVGSGEAGEDAQQHVLVHVLPVGHLGQVRLSLRTPLHCTAHYTGAVRATWRKPRLSAQTFKQTKPGPDKEKFSEVFISINLSVCWGILKDVLSVLSVITTTSVRSLS